MAIIKCKMCGGDLHPEENATTCECEYCGSVQTIPTADNEKKGNLFNRANRLRMAAEFDKAATVYASITAEFPEEAEAYWGLCLCKYGIEYVEDPLTAKKIPTCHRTRSESIMDDPDFDQACENADAVAKRVYREEAKAIDRLQQDILSVVANESPYDVFICYKETDDDGQRTEDSVLAQDIYDSLTAKGLKVFFARISLEDKLGKQYEPYIYAALHSAKVMIAVGTQFEYFDAVWVKNEWARFLDMMKSDKTKTLIPCFKGIDAYDMPREFKNLQAQNMGKLGWLQDLTRGVMKLCQKDGLTNTKKDLPVALNSSSPTIDSLLRRAMVFVEDQKWDEAKKYADRVLDMEVENGQAYLVKLMADLEVTKEEYLSDLRTAYDNNENYKKIMRFGNDDLKSRVERYQESSSQIFKELESRVVAIKEKYEKVKDEYTRGKKATEIIEKALAEAESNVERAENKQLKLKKERSEAKGLFYAKWRDELEEQIQKIEHDLEGSRQIVAQRRKELQKAKANEMVEPDDVAYHYELGNAYFELKRYEEAYKEYDHCRGYADADEKIKVLSGIIPNVSITPGTNWIIEKVSQQSSAQEMLNQFKSMNIPQRSTIYKQILDVLNHRALIERMYGVNHESTMSELRKIVSKQEGDT